MPAEDAIYEKGLPTNVDAERFVLGSILLDDSSFLQIAGTIEAERDNIPRALLGWVAGCIMIWSALFTVGNFLYGRMDYAAGLAVVFAASGFTVIRVVSRIWK